MKPKVYQSAVWMVRCIVMLGLLVLLGAVTACGPGLKEGSPVIRDFAFVGQDGNRPQVFFFKLRWQDQEADLSVSAEENVRTEESRALLALEIQDLSNTQQQPLRVTFPLRFGLSKEIGNVLIVNEGTSAGLFDKIGVVLNADQGTYPKDMKFTATLWDSKGNRSNQPWVILQANGS